jgi:hypothetical protein
VQHHENKPCIIQVAEHISKGLPTFAIAEISFDVRQNKCTKELASHPGRQSNKAVDAGCLPTKGNLAFLV